MIKRVFRSLLGRQSNRPPIVHDFTWLEDEPVQALEQARGEAVVTMVPVAMCRCLQAAAFRLSIDAGHPFVETALGILDGSVTTYRDSPMERYYRVFQPCTVADCLGVHVGDIGGTVLVGDREYVVRIRGGQHRAAVATALGFETLN